MSRYKELLVNLIIFTAGSFFTKLLLFLLIPLYTNTLTTAEFGIADLLSNSADLLLPVLTVCISESVFRFSIDNDIEKAKLLSNGLFVISIGSIILLVSLFMTKHFFSLDYVVCFWFLFLSTVIQSLFAQFVRGLGLAKQFAISGVVSALALIVFSAIFLIYFKLKIVGYLLSIIMSNLVSIIFLFYSSNMSRYIFIKDIEKELLGRMLLYSIPLIPNALSWWVVNISNRYVILLYHGASLTGLFAAASKMPAIINLFSGIFQQAWQYSSAKEYNNEGRDQFYSRILQYYSVGIFILASFLIIITPYLSRLILAKDFYSAWVYVPILLLAAVVGCFSYFWGTFYLTAKVNRMIMISTLCGAIMNVLFCLLLVPNFGIMGASIATLLGFVIICVIRIVDSRRLVKLEIDWIKFCSNSCILLIQTFLIVFINHGSYLFNILLTVILIFINRKSILELCSFIYKESLVHFKNFI